MSSIQPVINILCKAKICIEKRFTEAINEFPTQIEFLKDFPSILDEYQQDYTQPLLLWLYVLINNPFDIKQILSNTEIIKIFEFLYLNTNKHDNMDKFVFKTIARLLNNTRNYILIEEKRNKQIFHTRVLYEIVKINKMKIDIIIDEKESVLVQRYKVKTISYQESDTENINKLLRLLNTENAKLGWTLAKSIVRHLNESNLNAVVDIIHESLNDIFAKEYLWINSSLVFSMLILKGYDLKNMYRICKPMIFYDNRIENKYEIVREYGLFLLWSCIRRNIGIMNFNKENEIDKENIRNEYENKIQVSCTKECFSKFDNSRNKHVNQFDDSINEYNFISNLIIDLIIVSSFDTSLNCRRAASTVLIELIGRNKISNANLITEKINFHIVKRIENTYKNIEFLCNIVPRLSHNLYEYAIKKIITPNVFSHGKIYCEIIKNQSKCICELNIHFNDSFVSLIAQVYLFNAFYDKNFCKECSNTKIFKTISNLTLNKYFNVRFFDLFIENYLITMNILQKMSINITENVFFLLDKDACYTETYKLINSDNYELLYKNFIRKSNKSYILANYSNKMYEIKILEKYFLILQGNDTLKKSVVAMAISNYFNIKEYQLRDDNKNSYTINQKVEENNKNIISKQEILIKIIDLLLKGLEDYSVDYNGDIGSSMRQECLEIFYKYNLNIVYKYLIRYSVDKCPKLRNNSIKKLQNSTKNVTNDCEIYLKNYNDNYIKLMIGNCFTDEIIHLLASIQSFNSLSDKLKDEFVYGILCTFKNCDGYVYNQISKVLFDIYYKDFSFQMIVDKFFALSQRYLVLSTYFLYEIWKETSDTQIKDKIKSMFKERNDEKIGPRVKNMIQIVLNEECDIIT
ncbi:hypothetical protein COBT_000736 [Conglomerata obtusa]